MSLTDLYKKAKAAHGKPATDAACINALEVLMQPQKLELAELTRLVIADLNRRSGGAFRPTTKDTKSLIKARITDGHTLQDFIRVNAIMTKSWMGTDQQDYLRPKTLYAAGNFEGYLSKWHRANTAPDRPQTPTNTNKTPKAAKTQHMEFKPWHTFETYEDLANYRWGFETQEQVAAYKCPVPVIELINKYMRFMATNSLSEAERQFKRIKRAWQERIGNDANQG